MIPNRHIRYLLGILLGGLAGFSFTVSVVPYALGWSNAGLADGILRAVIDLWPWMAALWAVGGWSVARAGAPLPGGVILAFVGAGSGAVLAGLRVGMAPYPLLMSLLAGGVYGFLGGLILGRILAPAPTGENP